MNNSGVVHVFATGHSHMFAEELSANNNILQLRKIAEELTYV